MVTLRGLVGTLLCLLALGPRVAGADPGVKAGVVTTVQGEASVARASLPRPAPLALRDDVFFQDRVRTERESLVRILLGGKALVTVRELSDLSIQEAPNKATITLGLGRMALQVMKRLMGPTEEIEIRTPHAVAAIRGSFHFVDVTPTQTMIFNSSPTRHTADGRTYDGGANELLVFRPGMPPLRRPLPPAEIAEYSQHFLGGIPKLEGDKTAPALATLIDSTQMGMAAALASALPDHAQQSGDDPFTDEAEGDRFVPTFPPPSTNVCVNCQTVTNAAAGLHPTVPNPGGDGGFAPRPVR